jgi:hypothetical protein
VGFNEGIVDGDDVDVLVLNSIAEDDTTDTAESVDANLCRSHVCDSRGVLSEMRGLRLLWMAGTQIASTQLVWWEELDDGAMNGVRMDVIYLQE